MVERLRGLGLPGVTARTFHAHALSQLRHFWPSRHDGEPLPAAARLARSRSSAGSRASCPATTGSRPAKDLADEIEWAKSRRIEPARATSARSRAWRPGASRRSRSTCSSRIFEDYERAKTRAGRIDFDDLLVETVAPARGRRRGRRDRPRPQALVQRRRVPGHEPAPAAAARAVARRPARPLRRRRRGPDDLHVHRRDVGVPDRVRRAASRRPGPRPDPELPLDAAGPRARQPADRRRRAGRSASTASRGDGPRARRSRGYADADGRARTRWSRRSAALHRATAIAPGEIAVLVRMNAQLAPIEAALTRAGRRVPGPRRPLLRPAGGQGRDREHPPARPRRRRAARWSTTIRRALGRRRSGFEEDGATASDGREARERQSSLETLLAIVDDGRPRRPARPMRRRVLAELDRRAAHERDERRRRRQPPDVPPGEGPRVGRGLPADARGGLAADPPGARRRRGARRGAAPALRRDHPGARPPRALVGGAARDARPRGPPAAEPVPAGPPAAPPRRRRAPVRDLGGPPVAARPRARGRATTATRCSPRSASGAPAIARDEGMPRLRDRPRLDARGHRGGAAGDPRRASAASRAWARPSSRSTATGSWPFSPVTSVTTSAPRSTCRRDRPLAGKPMIAVETCHNRMRGTWLSTSSASSAG